MTHTFTVTGMTCTTCQAKIRNLFSQVPGVEDISINLTSGEVKIKMNKYIPVSLFQETLTPYPKYQLLKKAFTSQPNKIISWLKTYQPLLLIITYLLLVSLFTSFKNGSLNTEEWMNSFMAGFFLTFSFFKLLNLSDFATSYAMYDVVAKRIKSYGILYPFIEFALGIAYLVHFDPIVTNIATITIMGISTIGVIQSVINKRAIQCACLGTVFQLPMSTITIIENVSMIVMAAIGLLTIH